MYAVKSLIPSDFKRVVVLDIELVDQNVIKELGVFINGKVHGFSFRPPIKFKPTKQTTWCTKNLHKIAWNSGNLEYNELPKVLKLTQPAQYFAKGLEKCSLLSVFLGEVVENLEDYGCPKIQELCYTQGHKCLRTNQKQVWICTSYPVHHKNTLHCAELKAFVFGTWIMQHLNL